MSLPAGARLGPYAILELVGAGGMGEVYRARDPRLGRDVAIKVLPSEVGGDSDRLRRFEQEARAVAALNHPNILTVLDVGTHEGIPQLPPRHDPRLTAVRISPSGRHLVTGNAEGGVRVGPVTGEEPHLLLGLEGAVCSVAVSPDERWIASATESDVSIWPMPDVTKPPLHTLARAELLAKLEALTNLRIVRDPSSATGWKLDVGPFSGWKDVPTW